MRTIVDYKIKRRDFLESRKISIDLAEMPEIRQIAQKKDIPMDEIVKKALKKYMGEIEESKVDKWIRIINELVESAEMEEEEW